MREAREPLVIKRDTTVVRGDVVRVGGEVYAGDLHSWMVSRSLLATTYLARRSANGW